jgi:peptide deformylase
MAQRALVYYGNPILRQKAKKIHHFDASFTTGSRDV